MKTTLCLQVAVDVGSRSHYVVIGPGDGSILDEFTIGHSPSGFDEFFQRIEYQERLYALPVAVAMEGYNGWARPLDNEVLLRGWRLYNVNNLKLARFKEIFPAAAKSDSIDARKILELFQLESHLPLAKEVLQVVFPIPEANRRLKRLSRRRRQLVNEKIIVQNRLQSDLQAVCPSLVDLTGSVDNLWFLRFLTCRESLPKLLHLHRKSLFGIPGVGRIYAERIRDWQGRARFSEEVDYVGPMILQDAHRLLALMEAIKALENELDRAVGESVYARHIDTVPGFGLVCSAELAGEIGTLQRFRTSDSFAFYLGMAPLDN
ncbi:MAG: IS110 family transposase, partial [Gammaproteobacteria bacterium]